MTPGFLIILMLVGFLGGIPVCLVGAWLPGLALIFMGIACLVKIIIEFRNMGDEE